MKKKLLFIGLLMLLVLLTACNNNEEIAFAKSEYVVSNGDYIQVMNPSKGVKYKIVGTPTEGVSLSEDGKITFTTSIPNYTQVLVVATNGDKTSNEVVLTLVYDYLDSVISFDNQIDYVVDNEYITAKDTNGYGITYSIEPYAPGVNINSSNGKVSYTDSVYENEEFTVYARSGKSNVASHTFKVAKDSIVKTTKASSISELENNSAVNFVLDYSCYSSIENEEILSVADKYNRNLNTNYYSYNKNTKTLTITSEYIKNLGIGTHSVKIVTKRNSISVDINIATKFIDSVEDLVGINENSNTLAGYYIQTVDLDLTDYLKAGGKYYNKGKGWTPIGTYHDVKDTTSALKDAFTGTYDGNGHVIKGLFANRTDEQSFNFGLFGYITSSATIKNLGVEGSVNVSSYSGGICGTNNGVIENCYANVKVVAYTGGATYRYLGGLVGNNLGIINNSYAVGVVKCDTFFGQLVGYNDGKVKNCFAYNYKGETVICGLGPVDQSCVFFDTLAEMENYDFSQMLTSELWNLEIGSLPSFTTND